MLPELDEREFYELMQAYRWADDCVSGPHSAGERFQGVIEYVHQYAAQVAAAAVLAETKWQEELIDSLRGTIVSETVRADDNSLHDDIMNIHERNDAARAGMDFYSVGHRDAQHAAAELALAKDAEVDALRAEVERLRAALRVCASKAEALKRECGMDPWSAQATRNAQYQAISTTAHIALGTIRGPASAPVLGAGGEPG